MTNARTAKTAREKAAQMQADAARAHARRRSLVVALAVVAAVVVIIGAALIINLAREEATRTTSGTTTPPRNLTDGAMVVGQTDAPVTLTVYEDFQCPACRQFEEANADQIDGWAAEGTVKVEYRPISILDRMSDDRYSTRSANASAAVVDLAPQAWPAFHAALFAEQPAEGGPGLTDDRLVELAVTAGAPEAEVRSAVTDLAFEGWVAAVTTEATDTGGITGTPTVQVNGERVEDWSPESLAAAVAAATG